MSGNCDISFLGSCWGQGLIGSPAFVAEWVSKRKFSGALLGASWPGGEREMRHLEPRGGIVGNCHGGAPASPATTSAQVRALFNLGINTVVVISM